MVNVPSLRPMSALLLFALACTPAPAPPVPPDAPVLDGDGSLVFLLPWMLKGSAPADSVVRLFLDESCAGPALRDFTAAQVAEGVPVDLVSGIPNVFAAMSIDARGVSSKCSAPIRIDYQRPARPRLLSALLSPMLPTRETHFVIRGTVENGSSVQLFDAYSCTGTPISELTVPDFAAVGFSIDVEPNQTRYFAVQAVNVLGEASACSSAFTVTSDHFPPVLQPRILSPYPSPEQSAYVALSYEAAIGTVFLGADCSGTVLATCSGFECTGFKVQFPMAPMSSWSATAADSLNNVSDCVNAPESWFWDLSYQLPPITLDARPGPYLYGSIPAGCEWLEIYDGPTCGDPDHLRGLVGGARVAGPGYYTGGFNMTSDGGVLVARGLDVNMNATCPCSAPVPWL